MIIKWKKKTFKPELDLKQLIDKCETKTTAFDFSFSLPSYGGVTDATYGDIFDVFFFPVLS